MPTLFSFRESVIIDCGMKVNGISKKYGTKIVLDHVSFSVEKGGRLAILGPSGAGKTTLLRILAGLERADCGSIDSEGLDLLSLPADKRKTSLIFQDAALFPHTRVKDNILYGCREYEERLKETAELMKIESLLERYPSSLSGGEKQRVGIARALIRNPEVLLLDEPFASLDTRLKEELQKEVLQIAHKRQMTLITVTHDQIEASRMGESILLLREGKKEAFGSYHELYRHPSSVFCASFLGTYRINLFLCEVKDGVLSLIENRISCPIKDGVYTLGVRPSEVSLCEGDAYEVVEKQARDDAFLVVLRNRKQEVRCLCRENTTPEENVGIILNLAGAVLFDNDRSVFVFDSKCDLYIQER